MPHIFYHIVNAIAPRHRATLYYREFIRQDGYCPRLQGATDTAEVERRMLEMFINNTMYGGS
jgi:hypothetical protein